MNKKAEERKDPPIEKMGLFDAIIKATTFERLDEISRKIWGWSKNGELSDRSVATCMEMCGEKRRELREHKDDKHKPTKGSE